MNDFIIHLHMYLDITLSFYSKWCAKNNKMQLIDFFKKFKYK